jgi:hypothetical protein
MLKYFISHEDVIWQYIFKLYCTLKYYFKIRCIAEINNLKIGNSLSFK